MKNLVFIFISSLLLLSACGPSAEEQRREQIRIADSIKAAVADSLAKANAQSEYERKKAESEAKIKAAKPSFTPGYYYAIGRCNVRAYPSESAPIVLEIYDGEQVYAEHKQGKWYKIYIDGLDGGDLWTHQQNLRR